MEHTLSSSNKFGKPQNGHIQKSKKMETIGSVFFKTTLAAITPFLLLAVGLATLQLWALAASIFSASMIGLFHLYKTVKMVRADIKDGKKVNIFKRRK